jgi:hypothetical protein
MIASRDAEFPIELCLGSKVFANTSKRFGSFKSHADFDACSTSPATKWLRHDGAAVIS